MNSARTFSKIKVSERFPVILSIALLFSISFSYLYFVGNYIFSYQENRSLFFYTGDYFRKYVEKPGGLLEYSGNFLTQGYYSSIYGSLILAILLILQFIIFYKINKKLTQGRSYSLLFVLLPACILLLLQRQPDQLIVFNVGFLLVAIYFLFSIGSGKWQSRLMIVAMFPVFFYLAGSFVMIYMGMYLIYCIVYEKSVFRIFLPALLMLSFILVFIIFKDFLFLQPANSLLNYPMAVFDFSGLSPGSYLLLAYFILFPCLIRASALVQPVAGAGIYKIVTILAVFPITVFLLLSYRDRKLENLIHIEESVHKQDWDEVIKLHESSLSGNLTEEYYYNLALSEKGELCNRLFFGRQAAGVKSLSLLHNNQTINKSFYFYYAIGMIPEAHHLAYESRVVNDFNPENIKMLIKTELIVRNYRIAAKYINNLKKTCHYRTLAQKYETMLYDTSLINSDPELGKKTRLIPGRDFFVRPDDFQNIEMILIANPDNKRAFEYKLAYLLFKKDLRTIALEINKMKENGYTKIPLHIEEAVMEFTKLSKESPDLGGLVISDETKQRFAEYSRAYDLFKSGNKIWTTEVMEKTWANTFWYYFQFN